MDRIHRFICAYLFSRLILWFVYFLKTRKQACSKSSKLLPRLTHDTIHTYTQKTSSRETKPTQKRLWLRPILTLQTPIYQLELYANDYDHQVWLRAEGESCSKVYIFNLLMPGPSSPGTPSSISRQTEDSYSYFFPNHSCFGFAHHDMVKR